MKQKLAHLALLAGMLATLTSADAATMVLDDFTQGSFALGIYQPDVLEYVSLPLTNIRLVSGGGFAHWYATLSEGAGRMNYTLELRGDPYNRSSYLNIDYRRAGDFSILGYEAFSLTITNLVGQGEVMVYHGSSPDGTPVPITGVGELVIPFSKMNTVVALDNFSSLNFRLIGLTADFSVTLDQIALIPEPGCLALTVLGGLTLLRRRRT